MIAREKEEHKVMLKAQKENRKKLLLQRARDHYEKHYSMMMEIVKEIVTLTTKVGEYRILMDGYVIIIHVIHVHVHYDTILIHVQTVHVHLDV